jgi:cell division control protein 6
MLGVITTRVVSRGRYGRTKEISIDANTRQIYDVISSDPRLKEESLMQLDINQLRGLFR